MAICCHMKESREPKSPWIRAPVSHIIYLITLELVVIPKPIMKPQNDCWISGYAGGGGININSLCYSWWKCVNGVISMNKWQLKKLLIGVLGISHLQMQYNPTHLCDGRINQWGKLWLIKFFSSTTSSFKHSGLSTAMTDMVFIVGGIWINTMGSLVNFDVKWYYASPFVGEFNFWTSVMASNSQLWSWFNCYYY